MLGTYLPLAPISIARLEAADPAAIQTVWSAATLFVLQRLLGREAALDVARQIDYPYTRFLDDPTYTPPAAGLTTGPSLATTFLSGYRLGTSHLGVALYPGISELAMASVVDTYPHQGTLTVDTVAPSRTHPGSIGSSYRVMTAASTQLQRSSAGPRRAIS
jgi:hypothetical protein